MQDIQPISLSKKFLPYVQLAMGPGLSQVLFYFLFSKIWQIRPEDLSTTQNALRVVEVISWILLWPVAIAWGCAARSVLGKSQPFPLLANPNTISVIGKFGIVITLLYFLSALGMMISLSTNIFSNFFKVLFLILTTGCTGVGIMGATRALKH